MIKFNKEVLLEIQNSDQENYIFGPIWIYKSEKVFHQGRFYLKIYLFQNQVIENGLKGLSFEVNYNNTKAMLKSYEFKEVEAYKDKNIFGCVLEMPSDYEGVPVKINIHSYFTSIGVEEIEPISLQVLKLDQSQFEGKGNEYLRKEIVDYVVFPKIEDDYWQCKCGMANKHSIHICTNCGTTISSMKSYIETGINELILNRILFRNPFIYSSKESAEINIKSYLEKFEEYNLPRSEIVAYLQRHGFVESYVKSSPLVFDSKSDLEKIFEEYISPLKKFGFNYDHVFAIYDKNEISARINRLKDQEFKAKKSKKRFGILSVVFLLIALFIYFIGIDLFAYGSAYINYKNGNYVKAINQFSTLNGFLDSDRLLDDSKYLKAEITYEKNPEVAINEMIALGRKDYKDSKEKAREYIYQFGSSFFELGDYQNAIKWFSSIESYKDSTEKNLESHYILSKNYWDQKKYKDAIKYIEIAGYHTYKDSKALLLDYRYNYAIFLKNSSFYKEAIDIFNLIPNYKDTLEQLKSAKYGLAMHYYKINQYEEALTWFNGIKGYNDTNTKISQIKNILDNWEVHNSVVYDSAKQTIPSYTSSTLSRYIEYFGYYGKLSGGYKNQTIEIRIMFSYPGGSTTDTLDRVYKSGDEIYYARGWGNKAAPTGNFSYKIYYKRNSKWVLIDQINFRVQ
jgi:tetratricopeptide (TPR) repeat protein